MSDDSEYLSQDSEDESERDQTFVELEEILGEAMATPLGKGKGNPLLDPDIHNNPLEPLFKAQPTPAEMDPLEIIIEIANPTAEQQEVIDVARNFNNLKRSRTNIYASITRMSNNINKVMQNKDLRGWKDLERRAIEAKHQLWTITLELQKIPILIKKEEVIKALSYQKKIETTMAKITSHIQAM